MFKLFLSIKKLILTTSNSLPEAEPTGGSGGTRLAVDAGEGLGEQPYIANNNFLNHERNSY